MYIYIGPRLTLACTTAHLNAQSSSHSVPHRLKPLPYLYLKAQTFCSGDTVVCLSAIPASVSLDVSSNSAQNSHRSGVREWGENVGPDYWTISLGPDYWTISRLGPNYCTISLGPDYWTRVIRPRLLPDNLVRPRPVLDTLVRPSLLDTLVRPRLLDNLVRPRLLDTR